MSESAQFHHYALDAHIKALEDQVARLTHERDEMVGTLKELRIRFHSSGRRPEECYEMSIIDDALAHGSDRA